MKHPYEKTLFTIAYLAVAAWGVYEMRLPVDHNAVAEEVAGHLLLLGGLYGFFRLMLAHYLHWNAITWGVIALDMAFGLRFWYDAAANGLHKHILLHDDTAFYVTLGFYMVIRGVLLIYQRKKDFGWHYKEIGYRRIAWLSMASGVLAALAEHPYAVAFCVLAGTAASAAGWTETLEEHHKFSY